MKKKFVVLLIAAFLLMPFVKVPSVSAAISPPKNFKAASVGTKITVRWDYSYSGTQALYFQIFEYNYSTHKWNLKTTVKYPTKKVSFTGQSYGKHGYKARVKIPQSWPYPDIYSDYTSTDIAYVLHTPTYFKASVYPFTSPSFNGDASLNLKWDAVDSFASQILIYRKVHGTDPWFLIPVAILPVSKTSYKDTTAEPNTTYDYWITLMRSDNNYDDISNRSNISTVLTYPAPPTSFKANGIYNKVYMSWKHTKSCTGYKVYLNTGSVTWTKIATLNKNTTSFITGSLSPGKYTYQVVAYNATGNSPHSPAKTAYILKKPTGLSATIISPTQIKLTYNTIDSNATKIRISKSTDSVSYSSIGLVSATASYIIVNNLSPETKYYFKISAERDSNVSFLSDPVHITTPAIQTIPNEPEDLEATAASSSEIDLSWSDNSDNEDGFKVERKTSGGTYSIIATVPADTTTYQDTGLEDGKTYYYRVKAFNSKGDSAYSNEAHATTQSNAVQKTVIKLQPDNEMMVVNGAQQEIDPGRNTKPVIVKEWGRTVVPIRAIVEALGGTIEWDGTARKVTIHFNGTTIELWIDNPKARVNGTAKWIDENNHSVKPIIVNSRTMLPLRFVAENLGCKVDWDGTTRTITITYPAP